MRLRTEISTAVGASCRGLSGIYDVNTIANYDPEVVPLLEAPVGSSFERKDGTGSLEQVFDFAPEKE